MKKIEFLDLKPSSVFEKRLVSSAKKVIKSGFYILGPEVKNFEDKFSSYVGTKFSLGVGSGLDAISLSLKSLNLKKDDEVIVPSNTYIATWIAVSKLGAKIVPVEPNIFSYNIEAKEIEKKINKKTKAIIIVHLYGMPVDFKPIQKLCKKNGIYLIEDAAQGHGAVKDGVKVGNMSDFGAFSFYPTKNLGALGDAGAISLNNKNFYKKISSLRNYGSQKKYYNNFIGENSRLDEIQASFLSIKLNWLDKEIKKRRNLASRYFSNLSDIDKVILPQKKINESSWHLFTIRVRNRNKFMNYLDDNNIGHIIHYPIPPHLQKSYRHLGFKKGDYPIAEKIHKEIISIPLRPSLRLNEIDYISEKIRNFK